MASRSVGRPLDMVTNKKDTSVTETSATEVPWEVRCPISKSYGSSTKRSRRRVWIAYWKCATPTAWSPRTTPCHGEGDMKDSMVSRPLDWPSAERSTRSSPQTRCSRLVTGSFTAAEFYSDTHAMLDVLSQAS